MPYFAKLGAQARHYIRQSLEPGTSSQTLRHWAETLVDTISDEMVDALTGYVPSSEKNDDYRWAWRALDVLLKRLDIPNPNPHRDIYEWMDDQTPGELDRARREVRDMYRPVIEQLEAIDSRRLARSVAELSTGWADVDEKIERLRQEFSRASSIDDWRDVGRSCDGLLQAVGQATVRELPGRLPSGLSPTDFKGILGGVADLARAADGKELRALIASSTEAASHAQTAIDGASGVLEALADTGKRAEQYAQTAKHRARLEQHAGIAAEAAILVAAIARRTVELIKIADSEREATAQPVAANGVT